ncbi:MAG: hypothetical protein K2I03_01080 [Lachnospiraceae bacterium]|nr:hypothetical protein [Lachnospiraceae bacterium]
MAPKTVSTSALGGTGKVNSSENGTGSSGLSPAESNIQALDPVNMATVEYIYEGKVSILPNMS